MSNPGRIALITGGEGDLATAIAAELAAAGFTSVLAPGRRDLDVTDAGAVREFVSSLERIDLLVNNAAVLRDGPLSRTTTDDWDAVMAVGLCGAANCARAAARVMARQRGGHILSIGSYSALSGPAGQASYAAAKAGLIGLTKSLAAELGSRGVRANCVLPGFLETKFVRDVRPERRDAVLAEHALGRFNSVEDAARFIAFLDSMGAVSGQIFQLDSRIRRW